MTEQPDYTTHSGAEFMRDVKADPAKWAEAFRQAWDDRGWEGTDLADWFRDAMDAAVAEYKSKIDGA